MLLKEPENKRFVELLAPAGSKESFYAAINAGADAVYMAANKFGARAYADNFTDEDIFECSDYAHVFGKKIYLTVNTLLKDDEFTELGEMLSKGIFDASDGLIVQDLGVAEFIKKEAPHIHLHASTQMSVSGPNAAQFLADYGFTRIVPARELSLKQIKNIFDRTGIEIECFIHGSMCYSYSGQCLFSSILGLRSGNRGRCAQPCRLPYSFNGKDDREHYPLSLKDMCTLDILPDIIDAGAVSLKVEGRMKPPAYVSGVISVYRKYLDLINSGVDYKVDKKDLDFLSSLYVRGNFSKGYYLEHNSRDMITFESHGYNQDNDSAAAKNDSKVGFENDSVLSVNTRFDADFTIGKPARVIAYAMDQSGIERAGEAVGEIVEAAQKRAINKEDVLKSLKKLGNTVFETNDDMIDITMDDNVFYSLKGINELRRRALDDLKDKIKSPTTINNERSSCKSEDFCRKYYYKNVTSFKNAENSLLISSIKQARALANFHKNEGLKNLKRIYISEEILDIDVLDMLAPLKNEVEFYGALSFIRTDEVSDVIMGLLKHGRLNGLLVRNLEDLSYFSSCDIRDSFMIISDFSLYAFNTHSASLYDKIVDCVSIPLEMSYSEEKNIRNRSGICFEKVIYGHAPLMITANCVRKTFSGCTKAGGFEYLTDRKNARFPVKTECSHCLNIIYNSVPLMLKKESADQPFRVELSVEDYDKSLEVLRYYFGNASYPGFEHTTGWQTRPVM